MNLNTYEILRSNNKLLIIWLSPLTIKELWWITNKIIWVAVRVIKNPISMNISKKLMH
jgi:hypothetical protein